MATLTAFDEDVADWLHSFAGMTSGLNDGVTLPQVGSFARQDGLAQELVVFGRNETRTFSVATLTEAQELNSSARHRRFQVGWIAEVDDACNMTWGTITRPGTDPCSIS
jgi:hypothetical protein